MIRTTCPHCQLAQEFPDTQAGAEVKCEWCGEALTVGGPTAEFVPDAGPEWRGSQAVFAWQLAGRVFATASILAVLFGLIGLPILAFGYGWDVLPRRHQITAFTLVGVLAYGLRLAADGSFRKSDELAGQPTGARAGTGCGHSHPQVQS